MKEPAKPRQKPGIYSSWLGFLPPLAVFLGSKSNNISVNTINSDRDRQQTLMDIWQNTTLSNRDVSKKLVQFLIISNSKLEMAGDDSCLLVVASSVASQFENFGSKVLENGS